MKAAASSDASSSQALPNQQSDAGSAPESSAASYESPSMASSSESMGDASSYDSLALLERIHQDKIKERSDRDRQQGTVQNLDSASEDDPH